MAVVLGIYVPSAKHKASLMALTHAVFWQCLNRGCACAHLYKLGSCASQLFPDFALFGLLCFSLQDSLVIGARFDTDVHGEACRLAFYGRLCALIDPTQPVQLHQLRVFKVGWASVRIKASGTVGLGRRDSPCTEMDVQQLAAASCCFCLSFFKTVLMRSMPPLWHAVSCCINTNSLVVCGVQPKEKRGVIERVQPDGTTAIVRGMFKKETDPAIYINLKVCVCRFLPHLMHLNECCCLCLYSGCMC